jgi:polyisoprenoid-binding protein YceI
VIGISGVLAAMVRGRVWRRVVCPAVVLVVGLAVVPSVAAQVVPSMATVSGTLAFDASATLGDFTGETTTLSGRLVGATSLDNVRGWVEAPAASLVTGNGKRDRDMYKSLGVEKHPTLRFDLEAVAPAQADGDSIPVTLRGRFTLHGVSNTHAVSGWAWLGDGTVRFKGRLPINVKTYHVGGLSKMLGLLKMDEEIVVRIDVTFSR